MAYYRGDWYRGDGPMVGGSYGEWTPDVSRVEDITPEWTFEDVTDQGGIGGGFPGGGILGGLGRLATGSVGKSATAEKRAKKRGILIDPKTGLAFPRKAHRRMHVTNVRALRRAMRRVQGFAHLAKKTIGFTRRVHMKRRRKRA